MRIHSRRPRLLYLPAPGLVWYYVPAARLLHRLSASSSTPAILGSRRLVPKNLTTVEEQARGKLRFFFAAQLGGSDSPIPRSVAIWPTLFLLVRIKATVSALNSGLKLLRFLPMDTSQRIVALRRVSTKSGEGHMAEEDGDLRMAFMLGQANGNITLRRKQWDLAMKLNCTMLIWLGKQRLGQTDKGSLEVLGDDGQSAAGRITILRLPDNGRDTPEPTTLVYLPDNGRGTPDEILAEIEASKRRRNGKH